MERKQSFLHHWLFKAKSKWNAIYTDTILMVITMFINKYFDWRRHTYIEFRAQCHTYWSISKLMICSLGFHNYFAITMKIWLQKLNNSGLHFFPHYSCGWIETTIWLWHKFNYVWLETEFKNKQKTSRQIKGDIFYSLCYPGLL